jgi:hypothetical protein
VSSPSTPRQPVLLVVLSALLYLEAVALAALTVLLIVDAVIQHPDSYLSAVALIVLAALAAAWLAIMATHALARRPWIRAGGVTWQLLQLVIGITIITAGQPLGWALVAVAVVVLVLLFTPPVIAATRRDPKA